MTENNLEETIKELNTKLQENIIKKLSLLEELEIVSENLKAIKNTLTGIRLAIKEEEES